MNNIILQKILENIQNSRPIIWIPNPGNAGDAIIALGTYHFFRKNGIVFEFGNINEIYNNEFLIYSGGGNLVGIWNNCEKFLARNAHNNKILILPHTIKDVDHILSNERFIDNIYFCCRELESFKYVSRFTENVCVTHDMAFFISDHFISNYENDSSSGILNCFRLDLERTRIRIPDDNQDISLSLNKEGATSNLDDIFKVSSNFFEKISKYSTIHTNRLHVAIAASFLDKEVYLYPNNYYKSRAIYEYSLKDKYLKTKFVYE